MKKALYMDKYHCEPYQIISVNSHFKGMMDALFIKSDILDRRNKSALLVLLVYIPMWRHAYNKMLVHRQVTEIQLYGIGRE